MSRRRWLPPATPGVSERSSSRHAEDCWQWEVGCVDSETVSSALVLWLGWGASSWPTRDDGRICGSYGSRAAAELLPHLRELRREFDESDAWRTVAHPGEMAAAAAARFRPLHPELSDDAIAALAWCYSYTWR